MTRLILVTAACGLALAANAQLTLGGDRHHSVSFAEGHGRLVNRTDQAAEFAFRVRQVGDRPAQGEFNFATHVREHGAIRITSSHLNRLQVRENKAWFGGPAVLVVRRADGQPTEVRGHLSVHVVDNALIIEGDRRHHFDLMELKFTPHNSDRVFEFAGRADPRSMNVGTRRG